MLATLHLAAVPSPKSFSSALKFPSKITIPYIPVNCCTTSE